MQNKPVQTRCEKCITKSTCCPKK